MSVEHEAEATWLQTALLCSEEEAPGASTFMSCHSHKVTSNPFTSHIYVHNSPHLFYCEPCIKTYQNHVEAGPGRPW